MCGLWESLFSLWWVDIYYFTSSATVILSTRDTHARTQTHGQVGIEEMVAKVKSLDTYTRQMVAPLGIVFPFPLHCSKLDCFMNAALVDKGEVLDR